MPILSPVVRIDVMQRVLKDIFEDALVGPGLLNQITWGVSNDSREMRPFGNFDWLSGPSQLGQLTHEPTPTLTQSRYWLDIPASPTEDDVYIFRLNAYPHTHTVESGDTSEVIRDLFIASINADLEPATATVVSSTRILVEATGTATLWSLDAALPLVAAVEPISVAQPANLLQQRQDGTVSLSFYTQSTSLQNGAVGLAAKVGVIPALNSTLDIMAHYGFSFAMIAEPANDTALELGGALYEGRSTIDYQVGLPSVFPEPVDVIETALVSITIGTRVIPLTIPEI